MKRFGEKELKEVLKQGASIRYYAWFTADAGIKVVKDGEIVGYITETLFYKLTSDEITCCNRSNQYEEYMDCWYLYNETMAEEEEEETVVKVETVETVKTYEASVIGFDENGIDYEIKEKFHSEVDAWKTVVDYVSHYYKLGLHNIGYSVYEI